MKAQKGLTYLVIIQETMSSRTAWIVQQTGMKSWNATRFSQITPYYSTVTTIVGNSSSIFDNLEDNLAIGEELEIRACKINAELRREMFSILQTGKFESEV